ncbi:AraC family transcriptional regulator [Ruminococcaceae bacterium OttesenSCG-928-A16]|nr:AraC family transcriptional regulator [Ruminococcaceae bacterium OttesenSCG-928-A16]
MAELYKQSFKQTNLDNLELSIYNCGLQSCSAGYTWGPGVRDHYLIHLVTAGKGSYSVNNTVFAPKAGDLFFAKPNQLISYTADTEEPWEYYWVGYNGSNAARLAQSLPFSDENPVHQCQKATRARDLLHKIFLSRGPHVQDETRMVGYLYLFAALLMQESKDAGKQPPATGAAYVVGAIKYIQFNYSRDIGVDDIASAVGVSRSHLYRVFMANLAQSPIDYLTNFRIGEACKLLETSTLSVAEIAYSVGFFDQFYFSRVFKKMKGVPPSKYGKTEG